MTRLAALLAFAAVACKSSAPYTVSSAAINTAIAVGVSGARRASGDCFTPCTYGRVCNPKTGYCESTSATEVCDQGETGEVRCVPIVSGRSESAGRPSATVPGLGVSPQTGAVPPPPAESSPRPAPESP